MDKNTKEFIKIAYTALQQALRNECKDGIPMPETENAKKIADALKMVGDLSRME